MGLEIGGIFILVTLKILCTMAGVGGGGIVTPLCMVFYGFVTKDAVACAAFATFAATMGSFITSFKQKHPEKKSCVLTDYGLTCIMMPTTLAGAQIGSLILIMFPTPVIQILLVLMLIGLGLQSLRKGFQIRKKENARIKIAAEKLSAELALKSELSGEGGPDTKNKSTKAFASVEITRSALALEIIKHDPAMRERDNESRRSAKSNAKSKNSSNSKREKYNASESPNSDD